MVSKELSPIEQVFACIDNNRHFLLHGGAGSGKTHSLVEIIQYKYTKDPNARIACITYTNAAVDVVNERYQNDNLSVSTIHNFLWNQLKNYQKELVDSVIHLANSGKISVPAGLELTRSLFEDGVKYGQYLSLRNGQVSHDEVIYLADYMYQKHPLLARVTKSQYDLILIDEYQDTHKEIVSRLFESIIPVDTANHSLTIGLFGDHMQKIYETSVDDLRYDEWAITRITKPDNYRSCQAIIDGFNNKIRHDDILQNAVGQHKDYLGTVRFVYSTSRYDMKQFMEDFDVQKPRKALYLTHRLLARNAGYQELYDTYDTPGWTMQEVARRLKELKVLDLQKNQEYTLREVVNLINSSGIDLSEASIDEEKLSLFLDMKYLDVGHLSKRLVTDKENLCPFLEFLLRIEGVVDLYKDNKIPKMMEVLGLEIKSHVQRKALKQGLDTLALARRGTISDVIDTCERYSNIFVKGDRYTERATQASRLLSHLKSISYSEVINLYESLLKDDGEFGTQHSSKGNAYDNVVAVMDNGNWWQGSNYENIFTTDDSKRSDIKTRRLVYTAGSRAIKNLVIFFYVDVTAEWKRQKALSVIEDAKAFFGKDNVSVYPTGDSVL
ncbi:MAG TPA: AAA family ATPase [Candidatus Saccharibacteria bacterium]|nr:AAA family ATPase [Candidatus Saccharibacteria bacterium]HMR38632.1 AAA family ATPase [Candidatus Saccharibacteria bacterium]